MRRKSVIEGNAPSSDLMHDRAREAGSELRKALIGLASGSIGLMLVVFVSTNELDYTGIQLFIIALTVLSHAATVLCGLFAWGADAQRNYFWALELDASYAEYEKQNSQSRSRKQKQMHIADKAARYSFILGVVLIAGFVLLRLTFA